MSDLRELLFASIEELSALLWQGEITARELAEAHLRQIERVDPAIHAYLTVVADRALEQAAEADRKLADHRKAASTGRASSPPQPAELSLLGIPWACKDVLCTRGVRTTCGSRILEHFVPPYSATVVERLDGAGAVMLGKVNMDEFAMGSSTENSAFGVTRNPWDLERVPGGSSGGSAAAVAAGEAVFSLGSDTGGSVRLPAAYCGTVGLKPTYGTVSRYGLIAFASSLDQVGPLTRTVRDAALVFQAIAGHDPLDSTSAPRPVGPVLEEVEKGVRGLKLGLAPEYFGEGLSPAIREAVLSAVRRLEREGAEVVEAHMPHLDYALPVYYLIAPSEASSNLARYDGVRYGLRTPGEDIIAQFSRTRRDGFGPEVKRRIMLGTYALSAGYYEAFYLKAQKVRTLIRRDFEEAFRSADVLVTPVSPTVPFRLGEKVEDPLQMYLTDIYTLSVNLAGLPGVSVPCGFSPETLPIGLQVIGPAFSEGRVLRVARAVERTVGAELTSGRRPAVAVNGR
ncbi:MAG: Asp-tRNA(Asn)/Glu-tRNA(Gln) amidotransferase subunit GatA [Bacillota bacterium]